MTDSPAAFGRFEAWRMDGDVRIQAGYFGNGSEMMFGCLYTPSKPPRGGVLICSPLHADFQKSYRTDALLGRTLALEGFVVLRYHYRGQGHSDGEASRITHESLAEDAHTATRYLQTVSDTQRLAFVGCRLGAVVAASVAARYQDVPIALWEPVLSMKSYVREGLRALRVRDLKGSTTPRIESEIPLGGTQPDGVVDVFGLPIYRRFVDSMQSGELSVVLRRSRGPLLLVQIRRSQLLRASYEALVRESASRGRTIETSCISGEPAWWFRGNAHEREQINLLGDQIVTEITDWALRHVSPVQALG